MPIPSATDHSRSATRPALSCRSISLNSLVICTIDLSGCQPACIQVKEMGMTELGTGLPLTAADRDFRDEVRDWLADNLTGDFAGQSHRGGPDDDDNWELRREWEAATRRGQLAGFVVAGRVRRARCDPPQEILFAMEYAGAGAPPRAAFHGETLMAPTALHYGTPEQKQRLLPPMARGETVWCQGYSGARAGSDLAAISTKARLEDDTWVVNGQKIWTTFAHHADWIFAIVRTEPGSTRHAGLSPC